MPQGPGRSAQPIDRKALQIQEHDASFLLPSRLLFCILSKASGTNKESDILMWRRRPSSVSDHVPLLLDSQPALTAPMVEKRTIFS